MKKRRVGSLSVLCVAGERCSAYWLWWILFSQEQRNGKVWNGAAVQPHWTSKERNRLVGLGVYFKYQTLVFGCGMVFILVHLKDKAMSWRASNDRKGAWSELEVRVWLGTVVQAHLSDARFAEFTELVYAWRRKTWLWKQLKICDLQQRLSSRYWINYQVQHCKGTLFCKMLNLQEYLFPACGKLTLFVLVITSFPRCSLVHMLNLLGIITNVGNFECKTL